MGDISNFDLDKFSKHVPTLLRHQLLLQLLNSLKHRQISLETSDTVEGVRGQSSSDSKETSPKESTQHILQTDLKPSIERFYGVLLFVDISGFTVLSQRLNVDELRLHINSYFQKILDIAELHGGEAVKFAGDALYIVWKVEEQPTNKTKLFPKDYCVDALRKAIACGADINQSCSKYKICLDKRKSTDSQLTSMLLMSMPSHAASMASLSIANLNDLEIKGVGASEHNSYSATLDDSVAYLDVHSGISMGYMAGVDIGHDNRWEYFLIGKPLSDVALAEADAGQGELVISPIAHSVFHPAINTERTHSTRTTASFTRLSHATMTNLDDTPVRSPMLSPLKRTARIEHQQKFVAFESQSNDSTKGFVDTFFQAPRDTTHQHITVDSRENLNGNAIDKIFSNESDLPSVRSSADLKTLKLDLDNLMCSQSSDNLGFGSLKDASESCDDFNFEDGVYPGCLPCGCLVTPSGSFKICNTRRFVTKFGQSHYSMCSELSEVDLTLTKSFTQSISEKVTNISAENDSFNNSKNVVQVWSELAEIFDTTVANNSGSGKVPRRCSEPSPLGIGSQQSKKSNPLWSIFSDNYKLDNRVALSYASSGDRQNRDYLRWLLQCLLDDVVRHVHYVVRATAKIPTNLDFAHRETQSSDYRFMLTRQLRLSGSKTNESEDFVESIQTFLSKFQNISAGNRLKSISGSFYISSDKQGSPTSDFNEYQRSPLRKTSGLTVGKRRSRYHGESYLSAELRNVTVMFISIEAFNRTLLDSPSSTSPAVVSTDSEKMRDGLLEYRINKIDLEKVNNVSGLLSFLPRSNVEYADDHEILNKYQECIEVIVNALHARGGQLRQFIVDDKGTVSIGTFGLRGSAHEDDAAAAVESAQDIIIGLQKIGCNGSIGITSGKAYCGLVGSAERHEYAVMGPSTNLSARLMSKARAGEIICDASTRRRDRSHRYVIVGKVKAKGYEQMVTTYSPLLKDVLPGKSIHRLSSELSAKSLSPSSGKVHSFHDLDIEAFEEKVYSRQPSDRKGVPTEDVLIITAMKHRLHGRQEVVQSMLDFLMPFSDEAVTNAADLKAYLNYSEDGDFLCPPTPVKQDRKTFNCSLSATALVLSGKQGIGKTCILRAISEKLEALVQIDPSYNIHIFRGNAQILHKSVPLSVWRPLLSEIFTQFATFDTENGKAGSPMKCFTKPSLITSPSRSHVSRPTLRKDISGNGGKSLRKLSAVDIKTVKSKISVGIDVLTGYLAPEIRVLLPLLCSCFPHAPAVSDNEYTAKLHGVARLQSMLTLIQGIIDVYVKITDCVAFIVLDDLQFADSASWDLLHKLWNGSAGVVILAAHRRLAKGNGEGRYLHNDNFALFNDSSRFINVELSLLDYNTTMKICNDIFSSFGVRIQEQSVFDNIYEMSGGNGLYIHELSKAIAIQESKLQDKGNDQQHIFQINRVEEVICHRFDQFDPICQLLLKLASVACAGGAPFTASLLSHMLADDSAAYNNLFSCIWSKQNHDLTFITSMLSLILEKNEFIRISQANCKMQDGFDVDTLDSLFGEQAFLLSNKNYVHPSISAAISIDEDITEEEIVHGLDSLQLEQNAEYSFEFKVLLEQLTIYDLMLEEQKMALHERVAYYLNDRIPKSLDDVTSAALFAEQGFHWQQARQFKDAMRCFNTAGLILEKAGSFPDAFEQFHAAMRMFHLLRQDCGIGEQSMIDDGREITSKLFKRSSLVLPTGSDVHRPRSTTISENSEFSFKHLLKSDLQRIFHSDTESLAVAFSIVVKVAQCSVVLENDQTFCAKCFEEVVNFTLLLWPDGITPNLSTAVSPNLSPLPVQPPNRFSNLLLDIFPALNSMVSSFRNHKLGDDEAHTKEVAVCKLFLHLAETLHADCLNECQDSKYISNVVAHLIWGLVLQRELYTLSDFSNYEEVLDFSDRILALYDHSAHSAVISDHYGIDLVPQVLASTLFITIVQSDLVSTKRYFHAMVEMLPNLRSINLAATVTLPLISVASFLNYSSEVQELLLHYTMMEQENDHERQRFAEDQSSKKASVFSDGVAALRSSVRFQNDSVGAKLSTKQADIALADSNKSAEFTETIIFKEYTPLILLWFVRSTDSQTSFPAIDMSSLASPTSPQRGPWFTRLQSRSNSGQTIGSTYSSSLMELLKRRIRELRDANKRVLRKGYLFPIDSVRPAKYSVLASLGIEVEYLCGSICYHKFNESKSFPLMSSQSTKTGSLASSSVVSHSKSHFLGTQRYHFDHESRGRYLEMALDYIDSFFSREHVLSHHYFFRLMVNSILKAKTLVALAEAIKHEPIIDRGKDFGLDARSLLMSESVESDSGKMTMSQESESQRFSKAREIQILQWNQEAKECLSECARVGSEHHCTMLQIAAGHCLLELSLDIETGSRLISSALDNLQTTQLSDSFEGIVRQKDNSNDESGVSSNNNFTLLRQLFPSLKDFLM